MEKTPAYLWNPLKVDGGACVANDFLMQFQADILGVQWTDRLSLKPPPL